MTSIAIEHLFDNDRFPPGFHILPVLVYFPIGLVLALLRFFIGFHVFIISCILPKLSTFRRVVLRSMCTVLGIHVTVEGIPEVRDQTVKVMISNYTSSLDHLAVDLVIPCILPCVWDLPPLLMWILGYTDMGASRGRDMLIANAKTHCKASKVPMLVFPEGASTNGKVGLLKFSMWPFSLEESVQPIVITINRPFIKISPSVLGGRWWIDVFWFLFVPYSSFHIKVLPVVACREGEVTQDFTNNVQSLIAEQLNVQPTVYTSADKVEYAKRALLIEPSESRIRSPVSTPSQLDIMIQQVQEVLPNIPQHIIRRSLNSTKDVDVTITHLLEQSASGTPDLIPVSSASSAASSSSSPKSTESTMKHFEKDPSVRHRSLAERKQELIEIARRRYMEKHNML